jgi:pyridinium-3,5-biscarboxylic acid mononucleotide sulfurtransferase
MACLSSRVPYGEKVTPEKLAMIEAAENALRDLGFYDVRVRHHELPPPEAGPSGVPAFLRPKLHLARIEVGPSELPKFLSNGTSLQAAERIKAAGYTYVTVDLLGYRRGSNNEILKPGS